MYVLWHGVTLIPWPPQEPTPLRFPVWLGIPKPMIPYPLLWEGAVRTVGSHLGRIPNCSEVPDTPPPPHGNPGNPPPPREPPSPAPLLDPPLQAPPPPPPRGLRPTVSWGGSWRPGPRGRPPRAPPRSGGTPRKKRKAVRRYEEPPPPPVAPLFSASSVRLVKIIHTPPPNLPERRRVSGDRRNWRRSNPSRWHAIPPPPHRCSKAPQDVPKIR